MKRARLKAGFKRGDNPCLALGTVLGQDVTIRELWTPILWDDEEAPTFYPTQGLEFFDERTKAIRLFVRTKGYIPRLD